jgi:predicted NBD/HSP70 family sugar kinase
MRVGVDIGGTKTEAITLASDGSIAGRIRLATGLGDAAVVETAVAAVTALAAQADLRIQDFSTIGVGIPGAVDPVTGVVSHAINLGVERLELGAELATRFGAEVRVENDVNAAALGAFFLLERPAASSMAYLNLGTGLAAGLVLGGQLWRGTRGAAGEIGHILVDPAGPIDLDGQRGGLEVVASGSGIARQWGSDVSSLLEAAAAGDVTAIDIRHRLFDGVASAVRILVLTVDVDIVVIGGGLSGLGDTLMTGVTDVLDGWASTSPFIRSLDLSSRVQLLPAKSPVAAVGAAHLGGMSWPK